MSCCYPLGSEDEMTGECQDCGNPVDEDGWSGGICEYSPCECETCGWSPCDEPC